MLFFRRIGTSVSMTRNRVVCANSFELFSKRNDRTCRLRSEGICCTRSRPGQSPCMHELRGEISAVNGDVREALRNLSSTSAGRLVDSCSLLVWKKRGRLVRCSHEGATVSAIENGFDKAAVLREAADFV